MGEQLSSYKGRETDTACLAMIDATMATLLIAPGSCSSRLAFLLLLLITPMHRCSDADWKASRWTKQQDDRTILRRDELVHLLHLLRLPCPHKPGQSKPEVNPKVTR